MNWDQIVAIWKQLKDKIVFKWGNLSNDNGRRVELTASEMSPDGDSREEQTRPFRPDGRERRSEFSQHIGC